MEERDEFVSTDEGDPLEVFRKSRDRWLVDGAPSPFNTTHELLQYGTRVAMSAWQGMREFFVVRGSPDDVL
jgi:hypothetical protein